MCVGVCVCMCAFVQECVHACNCACMQVCMSFQEYYIAQHDNLTANSDTDKVGVKEAGDEVNDKTSAFDCGYK